MKAVLMTKKLFVIFRVRGDVLEHRKETVIWRHLA